MPKIKLFTFYLLSFTWGLLHTLVGLFVFLFVVIFMRNKVKLSVQYGRIKVNFPEGRFGGVSLGIVYMTGRTDSVRLNQHELGHTIQNIYFGPLFLPLIGIPSIVRAAFWRKIRDKHYAQYGEYPSYDRIWFESQATRLGQRHFKYQGEK